MKTRLCGWIGARAAPADARVTLERMAAARGAGGSFLTEAGAAVSAHGGSTFQEGALLAAVCGHAAFSDTELDGLARRESVAAALARAYAAHGLDAVGALRGDFALALLDEQRNEALIAIDRIGIHSITYALIGDSLVFASGSEALNRHPAVEARLDSQGIYDYVHFHMVPAPGTVYTGQHRLMPGEFLRYSNGKISTGRYWEMRFEEQARAQFPELRAEFLDTLRRSVREACGSKPVGTFLSGGTDSSTLAGLLGEVTGRPARTYSIGFAAQGYDEMEYARIAARHFGTEHHEYYVTPEDVVRAIPQIAAVHDQPFGNSSAVPTYYCAKLARDDGVETLLGGDGGDELFGGNQRYATQYLYSLYSDLPGGLRRRVIEPAVNLLPPVGLLGKAQRYIHHASQPMPARYDNYNLLERLRAEAVFTADFLREVDRSLPLAQLERAYHGAHAKSLINRMLSLDLKYTLADNDLPKVLRSCELAGVEVRFPLLSDALVAFSARLPPSLKLKGTRLRYFFKEALRGFLPDEIITKTKHGFGLPFGPWLRTHQALQQIALDSLADLKKRGIVRPEFIDELIATHLTSHVGYYGTMVWILMMLEQWLAQHSRAA